MSKRLVASLMALMLLLAGCGTSPEEEQATPTNEETNTEENVEQEDVNYPQLTTEVQENERVVEMETSMGTITIKLFPEYAPKAVENFITHSENGYYEGVTFHRVMNNFMIQGGDPEGTGKGGESIYGESFEDEFYPGLYHFRGALSMANSGPNTNGSQFFIVQAPAIDDQLAGQMEELNYPEEAIEQYKNVGGTPWLDKKFEYSPGAHTVFGQVIEGMDVVDEIASVQTDDSAKPLDEIVINKITVVQ